jgi:hypothetical protein
LRYSLSDDSAFCTNCVAFSGQISTPEFPKSGFRNFIDAVGEKLEIFNSHAKSERNRKSCKVSSGYYRKNIR